MKIISFRKTPRYFRSLAPFALAVKVGGLSRGSVRTAGASLYCPVPPCSSLSDWRCPRLPLSPFVISRSRLPWAHPIRAHNHQKHLTKISGLSQCLLLVFFSPLLLFTPLNPHQSSQLVSTFDQYPSLPNFLGHVATLSSSPDINRCSRVQLLNRSANVQHSISCHHDQP